MKKITNKTQIKILAVLADHQCLTRQEQMEFIKSHLKKELGDKWIKFVKQDLNSKKINNIAMLGIKDLWNTW